MKRIFMVVILLATGIAVFAQQNSRTTNRPSSDQTKQNAKQYLEQAKSASQKYDAAQSDLQARNVGNDDERHFNQLRAEIERLEAAIVAEQNKISNTLERGIKVGPEVLDNVQKMLEKHKQKVAELEAFSS
jgi:type II secretory pathway pseudopilin PulG